MGSSEIVTTIIPKDQNRSRGYITHIDGDEKFKAETVLLGAMLREPFNLHNYVGHLSRVALSNAGKGLGKVFIEILDQFVSTGNYSITTVAHKVGTDGFGLWATDNTDVDLEWAVEMWWNEYSIWAEATALMAGVAYDCMEGGSIRMRETVEEKRRELGADGVVSKPYDAEDFLTWGIDKLAGNEAMYPTTVPFIELRAIIKQFKPRYMWIIGGNAGMGKTQLALNLASNFHDSGAIGLFFSLEMTSDDVFRRLLGIRHDINHDADWSTTDPKIIQQALTETASTKDTIDVIDNVYHISEIEAIATSKYYAAIAAGKPLNYIFVDYLQMVVGSGKHTNRENEVGSVSSALARLAKRLNVVLFALSPISRENTKRGGSKRPQLADLRESGRIEYDAYGVIFTYRAEYYGITEDEQGRSLRGKAEIIVAKHKNGRVGTAICDYSGTRGFTDSVPEFETKFVSVDFTASIREKAVIDNARPMNLEDVPF